MSQKPCEALPLEQEAHGPVFGHAHEDGHAHVCSETLPAGVREHAFHHAAHAAGANSTLVTVRCHSGISGDILLAGLALMNFAALGMAPHSAQARTWLDDLLKQVMPDLAGSVIIRPHAVGGVCGWQAMVDLPRAHEHRNLADIRRIIASSGLLPGARALAESCFERLAAAESAVHGQPLDSIHFHEVGALDSILDICVTCELFERLGPIALVASPLPVADGCLCCNHGILPAPAPAVLRLLEGVPVVPFAGQPDAGELVTPTGVALLRTLGAVFGPWPAFNISASAVVYGQKVFPHAPNGAVFAMGAPL